MEKVYFAQEQPTVVLKNFDGLDYIRICTNGEWADVEYSTEEPHSEKMWQCDYNEIVVPHGTLSLAAIQANPEHYLDYVPEKAKTQAEEIRELKEQNEMLTQCVLEMSEILYG